MLIDKKGMLNIFGWRINIIDFLVLLFVLCLTPTFYFSYKIMTKPVEVKPPTITLNKAEYEKEKQALSKNVGVLRQEVQATKVKVGALRRERDTFLSIHKRAKKYFTLP